MNIIYLATPYSSPDAEVRRARFDRANEVAAELIKIGYVVYSPVSHGHPIAMAGNLGIDWETWRIHSFAMLAKCQELVVLDQEGWVTSEGVNAEIEFARTYGMPVEFICTAADYRPRE